MIIRFLGKCAKFCNYDIENSVLMLVLLKIFVCFIASAINKKLIAN